MNKEEIQKQLGKAEARVDELVGQGNTLRKEFAKAFNWYRPQVSFSTDLDVQNPTWIEIFVEVGKILENQGKFQATKEIEELGRRVLELEEDKLKEKTKT